MFCFCGGKSCGWTDPPKDPPKPSLGEGLPGLIKAHTDSTRFNKKIIRGNLWKFVAECGAWWR